MTRHAPRASRRAGWVLLAAGALAACSPEWNWRSMAVAGTPLAASFPCKPETHARDVTVAGRRLRLTLHACHAHDTLFAIGWAPVADPADLGPVLAALRAAAAANLGASPSPSQPFVFPGATPNPEAGLQTLTGVAPDGRRLQLEVAVFAVGPMAYQATVVGPAPQPQALRHFFGAIGLAPTPASAGASR